MKKSKASQIMSMKIKDELKLEYLNIQFEKAGKWADENQTVENTDALLLGLQEILDYIITLERNVGHGVIRKQQIR